VRSAKDYDTDESLRQALVYMDSTGCGVAATATATATDEHELPSSNCTDETKKSATALNGVLHLNQKWDWVTDNLDHDVCEAQTVDQELQRLKAVVSYMILDADREETFDQLTRMAAQYFKCPIALVSLVDLGRQWFMSNHGMTDDVRQTPRKVAFCAHAIQLKNSNDIFMIPDAAKDHRFANNPLVVRSPPNIRFYAGAQLLSPEGFKLGTFCIMDVKPRPEGLSDVQKKCLLDFAAIAVKTMADRRNLADQEDPSRLVACTAHDLLTPLSGVLLSLTNMKDDEEFDKSLNEHQKECIATATRSSEMMRRICQTTIETIRKANKGVVVNRSAASSGKNKNNNASSGTDRINSNGEPSSSENLRPYIDIREFVKSLHMIIDPIPKRVPLVITVASSVPMYIVSDYLKIFRSSLNLLSNACRNTETGSIRFRMFTKNDQLVFECEDSGEDIDVKDRERLFHPQMDDFGTVADLGLYSMAAQIDLLGGQYGFRPRGEEPDGSAKIDAKGRPLTGSIFWFSIPIVVPSDIPRQSSRDGITHMSEIRSADSFASAAASMSSTDTAAALSRNNSGLLAVTAAAARSFSMTGSSGNCLDSLVRTLSTHSRSSAGFGQGNNHQPLRGTANSTWDQKKTSKPMNINILRIRQALGSSNSSRTATAAVAMNAAATLSNPSLLESTRGGSMTCSKANIDRKKKALVIEDSTVVRKTLSRALQKIGYEVAQAVDGMEGLNELKKTVFDVTFCDFLMPNMDGLDCVQQYRKWEEQNRPSFRQYIVGISAHAGAKDVAKGLEIGMNDFRPKPVTIKHLKEIHEGTELAQVRATLDELHKVRMNSSDDLSLKGKKQKMDADAILSSAANLSTASLLLQQKRKRRSDMGLGIDPNHASGRLRKRGRFSSEDLEFSGNTVEKVCLVATDSSHDESDFPKHMAANGWKVTHVQDGSSVLRMLKTRNWGAVLLDDELPIMSGSRCVAAFREWELKNRVCRQNNVFLVCRSGLPSPHDATSVVQAPCGFDGALDAPVMWKDVKYLLKKSQVGEPQHRGGLNIVLR